MRLEYWVPHGRSAVRKLFRQCKTCCRCEGSAYKLPNMPPWPIRSELYRLCLSNTNVLAILGHFILSNTLHDGDKPVYKKEWVCLLTCMVVRAVHLELVEDMSADEFLLCLCRLIARRGVPRQIISDNAKQFKAAKQVLRKARLQIEDCANDYLSKHGIHWKFIVELAPWMGGFYECLVGLIKRAIRKILGSQCLTEKQLVTILAETEAVVNSWPLVYVDDDTNSSMMITPTDFLSFRRHHVFPNVGDDNPDPEFEITKRATSSHSLLETWKKGQNYLDQI